MEISDNQKQLLDQISLWSERAEIARKQKQEDVAAAAEKLISMCQSLLEVQREADRPEVLKKANHIRKQIVSTEQHRTMCVEHGLGNEAIDATYEIQALERQLVDLMRES